MVLQEKYVGCVKLRYNAPKLESGALAYGVTHPTHT